MQHNQTRTQNSENVPHRLTVTCLQQKTAVVRRMIRSEPAVLSTSALKFVLKITVVAKISSGQDSFSVFVIESKRRSLN